MLEQLYTQHEDDDLDYDGTPIDDPLLCRRLLIALQVNERKVAQLRATMAAIQGEYQGLIDAAEERQRRIRESLEIYVERNGAVSFPDVGSASLQHRKPSVKVVEDEAFAGWLIAHGHEQHVAVDQKYTFGSQARPLANAFLKREGEVPRGCEVVPESQSLVVRKAG